MNVERHGEEGPSLSGPLFSVRREARKEATRSARPEAGVEHLLLGLLADGGPSARGLVRAGVDLPRLRAAVVDLQDLPGPAVAVPPALQRSVAYYDQLDGGLRGGGTPFNGRAWELLGQFRDGLGDDRQLLLLLLDDPRVVRVLERVGVDLPVLRRTVRDGLARPADAGAPSQDRDDVADSGNDVAPPWGGAWTEARYSRLVPVAPEQVWAVLVSPQRRPEWDPRCGSVEVDPHRPGRFGTRDRQGEGPRLAVVTRQVPGHEVWWERARGGAEPSGRSWTEQARLEREGVGTVLHLRLRWPRPGGVRRLLRPLSVLIGRTVLRSMAERLTQAASRPAQAQREHGGDA